MAAETIHPAPMPPRPVGTEDELLPNTLEQILADGELLVKAHAKLLREEIKEDAKEVGLDAGVVIACGALALVGYIMLHIAVITCFAAFVSLGAGAWAAIALTIFNLAVAAGGIFWAKKRLEKKELGPERTMRELERDKNWIKELPA